MSIVRPIHPGADYDACYICGRIATETHHCWHGSNRQLADEDGLTVRLCIYCHRLLHDHGYYDRTLMRLAEWDWMRTYGTEDDFIKRYGKSVIDGRVDPREEEK